MHILYLHDVYIVIVFLQGNSYPGQGNPYGMYQGMGGASYQTGQQMGGGSPWQGQYGFSGQQGAFQQAYGTNPVNYQHVFVTV